MLRDDIIRFARRNWAAVARAKQEHWLRRKESLTLAALLQQSDDLLRYARAVVTDAPSAATRLADLEVHERVGQALRAVARTSR